MRNIEIQKTILTMMLLAAFVPLAHTEEPAQMEVTLQTVRLEELIRQALLQNPSILAAKAEWEAAKKKNLD